MPTMRPSRHDERWKRGLASRTNSTFARFKPDTDTADCFRITLVHEYRVCSPLLSTQTHLAFRHRKEARQDSIQLTSRSMQARTFCLCNPLYRDAPKAGRDNIA